MNKKEQIDILQIVKSLKNKGYDGLVNEEIECGCSVDDLNPCMYTNANFDFTECVPGYHRQCVKCDVRNCYSREADGHCLHEEKLKSQKRRTNEK